MKFFLSFIAGMILAAYGLLVINSPHGPVPPGWGYPLVIAGIISMIIVGKQL